jgi:arabinosyltransferase
MDRYLFMNSKTLFVFLRKDASLFARVQPVMVHVNYHSDKFVRMKAVLAAYRDRNSTALLALPDASSR